MTDEQDYISVASSAEAPDSWDSRTLRLLGPDAADVLAHARVLVAGVGGVGGYVVEMLARSGVGHLVLVDSDTVAESNLNRQIIALRSTVGQAQGRTVRGPCGRHKPRLPCGDAAAFPDP